MYENNSKEIYFFRTFSLSNTSRRQACLDYAVARKRLMQLNQKNYRSEVLFLTV